MAGRQKTRGRDPFEDLYAKVAELEAKVEALSGNKLSTIDRGDPDLVPAPVDGQQITDIADDSLSVYANGEWRKYIHFGFNEGPFLRIDAVSPLSGSIILSALGEMGIFSDDFISLAAPTVAALPNGAGQPLSFAVKFGTATDTFTVMDISTGPELNLFEVTDGGGASFWLRDGIQNFQIFDGSANTMFSVSPAGAVAANGGAFVFTLNTDSLRFRVKDSSNADMFTVSKDHGVTMPQLPTSDPGDPGQLYQLAGAVMISL